MRYRVTFSPEADAHLVNIYQHIAESASPAIAKQFTDAIVDHCEAYDTFPQRGTKRDDLRPGLRIVGFRRRIAVALMVEGDLVTIIGVFYGGQDYETVFLADEP